MKNINKLLKVSSLLYLLESLLIIPFAKTFGGLLLIIGSILLSYSFLPEEELRKKKVTIIIIDIISFLLNIVSAIIILIAIDEISSIKSVNNNSPPTEKSLVTTETKRIDLLLKLGLGMILISGILFATTSWEIITDIIKIVALIIMGGIFLGLSKFSEVKLKKENTTKAYYILGLSFLFLTWIGIGYFGIFSKWFSFSGEGRNLFYFITFIILSLILYLIKEKFSQKEYQYLAYISSYLSFYHILSFIGLDLLTTTLFLSILSLIINFMPNNKILAPIKELNETISYLYWSVIITQCFKASSLITVITSIINIVNLLYLTVKSNNVLENICSIIISYILILIIVIRPEFAFEKCTPIFMVTALLSLLIKYNKFKQNNHIIITNQVLFNIIATAMVISISTYSPEKLLIMSILYFAINILNSLNLYKTTDETDFRYQPAVILILVSSILLYVDYKFIHINGLAPILTTTLIFTGLFHFIKNEKIKKYYHVLFIISSIVLYLLNLLFQSTTTALVTIALSVYIYFTRKKKATNQQLLAYIFILLTIYTAFITNDILKLPVALNSILVLLIYGVITLTIRDKKIKNTNYIAIIVPLYSLVSSMEMSENISAILYRTFAIYILFLINKLMIKDKQIKDLFSTIGLIIILYDLIFMRDLLAGLYIGILGAVIIFLTYNKGEYKKLFYCGLGITVINIIVQLWEYWAQIPFWLYLLLVGISIVGFVTYKEMRKKDEPPKPITEEHQAAIDSPQTQQMSNQSMNEQSTPKTELIENLDETSPKVINFCPYCGTRRKAGIFCETCGKRLID